MTSARPSPPATRFARAGSLAIALLAGSSAWAQDAAVPVERHSPRISQFPAGGKGTVEALGVAITVQPELSGASIRGFLVNVTYQDPITDGAPLRTIVPDQFIPADCDSTDRGLTFSPGGDWTNVREVHYAVQFGIACRSPGPGLPPFAVLLTNLGSSDPEGERRLIEAVESNHLFDISASTIETHELNATGEVIQLTREVLPIVGAALTLVDLVALTHGDIAVAEFAIKFVVGEAAEELLDMGLEYVQDQVGHSIVLKQAGWLIRCRVCGRTFTRKDLRHGQLLSCPNHEHVKAYIYFD